MPAQFSGARRGLGGGCQATETGDSRPTHSDAYRPYYVAYLDQANRRHRGEPDGLLYIADQATACPQIRPFVKYFPGVVLEEVGRTG